MILLPIGRGALCLKPELKQRQVYKQISTPQDAVKLNAHEGASINLKHYLFRYVQMLRK